MPIRMQRSSNCLVSMLAWYDRNRVDCSNLTMFSGTTMPIPIGKQDPPAPPREMLGRNLELLTQNKYAIKRFEPRHQGLHNGICCNANPVLSILFLSSAFTMNLLTCLTYSRISREVHLHQRAELVGICGGGNPCRNHEKAWTPIGRKPKLRHRHRSRNSQILVVFASRAQHITAKQHDILSTFQTKHTARSNS